MDGGLDALMKGQDGVLITHRFGSIRNADTIPLLQGRLGGAGQDTRNCWQSRGIYADLFANTRAGGGGG